ncbi:MAG TPA: hypothetical protein VM662_07985 [Sphingomonas sp.]|nr:hypothetical protein [Sphingomonas sp.]
MHWTIWIRQAHRWLAILFTLGFTLNLFIAMSGKQPPFWVYLPALIPLFLLLPTGLYLWVLPHAARWRARQRPIKEIA